jgi:hypothetical protein
VVACLSRRSDSNPGPHGPKPCCMDGRPGGVGVVVASSRVAGGRRRITCIRRAAGRISRARSGGWCWIGSGCRGRRRGRAGILYRLQIAEVWHQVAYDGGWFRAKVGYPGGRERGWRGVMRVDEPPSALEGRLDTNVDSQLLYPRWLQRNVVPSTSVPTPGRSPVDPGTSPVVPSPPGR